MTHLSELGDKTLAVSEMQELFKLDDDVWDALIKATKEEDASLLTLCEKINDNKPQDQSLFDALNVYAKTYLPAIAFVNYV